MNEPLPFPFFRACRASQHHWIRKGYAQKIVWTQHPDGSQTGVGGDDILAISEVGPVCVYCGMLQRSFSEYPRPVAPTVAP